MCTHEMKRDTFVFRVLVLIFMLNCGLILQRHDVGSATPYNPDVVLEIPEQLNETLVYDTTDSYMLEMLEELNFGTKLCQPTPRHALLAFAILP